MTKEPKMIDGFKLSSIKEMLFEGKRDAISTKTFEEIIYVLEAKEQECDQLKAENEKMSKGYEELTEIVSPYIDDFTGYNEELKGFDIVLCVKELMQQLDQLKTENKEYKNIIDKLAGKTIAITSGDKPFEFCDHKDLTIKQLKADKEILKKDKANLDVIIETLKAQFNQLKEENDELQEKIKAYDEVYSNHDVLNERNNYKQALQKIKEICKLAPKETTCDRCHTFGFPPEHELIKVILQKCEEVG